MTINSNYAYNSRQRLLRICAGYLTIKCKNISAPVGGIINKLICILCYKHWFLKNKIDKY